MYLMLNVHFILLAWFNLYVYSLSLKERFASSHMLRKPAIACVFPCR